MAAPTASVVPASPGPSGMEFGPDSGGRLKGVRIVKPIIVGNSATYFGKKREEDGHTHHWTIYVKPYENQDYSGFIKKVHFKLHDSYANPNRIITQPPYEVQETGWGEFDVMIKIHFNDPLERPVAVYHILKLFQPGTDPTTPTIIKKFLVSEFYDEIVFHEPSVLMKSLLDGIKPLTDGDWKHEVDFEEKKKSAAELIEESRKKVKAEIQDLKFKLTLARETIDGFKSTLTDVQKTGASVHATPVKSGSIASEPVAGTSKSST